MKNKDVLMQERGQILTQMNEAIQKDDQAAFAEAFEKLSMNIQENILNEVQQQAQMIDATVLSARGVNQLTSDETKYYQAIITAMRSDNPKQALSDVSVVMPKTVIDRVFEDLAQTHLLLDAIDFQNVSGLIEMYINTDEVQLATWGPLCDEIRKELNSGFAMVQLALNKLSAFLPVCKAMLDLGPTWLDRYVREILTEAIYNGLEEGIINGTGKNMPIGMMRQVGEGVTVTDGVYPEKTAEAVKTFDAPTYGALLARLAKTPKGKARTVQGVILVVNPTDYFQKVMPGTTIMTPTGTFVNNVLPYPTTIIQSAQVPEGKAVLGLGRRYFMGIGTAKSGKIEYSDEYHFLEDERVYLTKLYGHGLPMDNNAFMVLDISALEPVILKVKTVTEEAGAQAATAKAGK
ncbi:MAG: phage major capsid protein [Eubacteriales bacterium]|nr:phage major capsid protein [Eubacteriales bacterium]